ncbi:Glutathione S-transferase zeta-1 [Lunasporangiospora selenospora]|uniref:Glutathione S-transferase zeta-1 n=1 Tax=Lunasporangiospora selenospora TaxID=979761 RepID=A0A9P6KFJ7_9FUNG|nr:Glutathione S-transferase zeta-1 [Lunasporangiospora selenospora]
MSPPEHKAVLYTFWRSSCAWRVRLGLQLKGIPYETKSINLLKEENRTAEYKKIQPFGAVPAFIDNIGNGNIMIESIAILEYLDETRPDKFPLLPKDPADRQAVRALTLAIAMDIQPVASMRVLKYVGQDKQDEWARHFMTVGFQAVESMLEKTAGKYAFGDSITMADLALVPQYTNGLRAGLDMSVYSILSRINNTLEQVEEFKAAHPTSQPDYPADV